MPDYTDPNDPDFQMLVQQNLANSTPEQVQQLTQQPGTPGAQQDQQPQSYYDVNAGAMFGGAAQSSPDPNQFYSGLQRGEDGNLQGVGPGMSYDRQAILQRAFDAGQLPAASDQGQQFANQPQQPQAMDLHQQLAQAQLTGDEKRRLTQAQYSLGQIQQKVASGAWSPLEGQRAASIANGVVHTLSAKSARADQLAKLVAFKDAKDQHAMTTALDIGGQGALHQAALARATETLRQFPNLAIKSIDAKGGLHFEEKKPEKEAAGGAADAKNDRDTEARYFKVYDQVVKQATADAIHDAGHGADGKPNVPNWASRDKVIAEQMEKHGFAPTWAEQRAKGGPLGVTPQSSAPGTQPTAQTTPQQSPPVLKALTPVEAAAATRTGKATVDALRERADMPPALKATGVAAITGMQELLAQHKNDITTFSPDEMKQYMQYRQVLEAIPKPGSKASLDSLPNPFSGPPEKAVPLPFVRR